MKNYTITVNGKSYEVSVEERGGASAPVTPVASAPVAPVAKAAPASSGSEGRVKVVAPMSGKILGVKVSVGQAVKKGEVVAVLEAMKMENDIVALEDGTIASINVNVGDSVETNQTLVTIN
ncbi:biotin/lipoyl-containing protein [Lachnoanaerobaculum sp.]